MWGKRAEVVVHQADPFNAEPPGAALAGERVTGVDLFYARNHGPIPDLDRARWQLRVNSAARRPGTRSGHLLLRATRQDPDRMPPRDADRHRSERRSTHLLEGLGR